MKYGRYRQRTNHQRRGTCPHLVEVRGQSSRPKLVPAGIMQTLVRVSGTSSATTLRCWCAVTRSRARVLGQHARKKVLNRSRRRHARNSRRRERILRARQPGRSLSLSRGVRVGGPSGVQHVTYLTPREAQHALSDATYPKFRCCPKKGSVLISITMSSAIARWPLLLVLLVDPSALAALHGVRDHRSALQSSTMAELSRCAGSVAPARCELLANASLPFISSIAVYGDDVAGDLRNCSSSTPNSRCAPISFGEATVWYPYLSSLYGESSDLPDAASLGWFYYDPTLPLCAICMQLITGVFSSYERGAQDADLSSLAIGTAYNGVFFTAPLFTASAFGFFVHRGPPAAGQVLSSRWLEVLHVADQAEETYNVTWFWPVRGSGVFLDLGWQGVLVEGHPIFFEKLIRQRPRSLNVHLAACRCVISTQPPPSTTVHHLPSPLLAQRAPRRVQPTRLRPVHPVAVDGCEREDGRQGRRRCW